ncbi:hypothetical protein [Litorivivens sp.]|uniref:hypothetical protein n=1 Tax=Litorivivens sp. TaxID=2020868 RepID=UPI003568716E
MNRWLVPVLCVVIVALVVVQVYFYQTNRAFQQNVASELAQVRAELEATRAENRELRSALDELQANDLNAIVDDASEALVTGWNTMLEVLESELRKAEQAMRERREQPDNRSRQPESEDHAGD